MWVEQFWNWRRYRWHVVTTLVLILNTALFIILGFLPLLDNFYHILALGTGALLAPALLRLRVCCLRFMPTVPCKRPAALHAHLYLATCLLFDLDAHKLIWALLMHVHA